MRSEATELASGTTIRERREQLRKPYTVVCITQTHQIGRKKVSSHTSDCKRDVKPLAAPCGPASRVKCCATSTLITHQMFLTRRPTNEEPDDLGFSDMIFHFWPYRNHQPHYLTQPMNAIDQDVWRRTFRSVEPGYLVGSIAVTRSHGGPRRQLCDTHNLAGPESETDIFGYSCVDDFSYTVLQSLVLRLRPTFAVHAPHPSPNWHLHPHGAYPT
jgi:hypothetical protein